MGSQRERPAALDRRDSCCPCFTAEDRARLHAYRWTLEDRPARVLGHSERDRLERADARVHPQHHEHAARGLRHECRAGRAARGPLQRRGARGQAPGRGEGVPRPRLERREGPDVGDLSARLRPGQEMAVAAQHPWRAARDLGRQFPLPLEQPGLRRPGLRGGVREPTTARHLRALPRRGPSTASSASASWSTSRRAPISCWARGTSTSRACSPPGAAMAATWSPG